MYNMRSRLRLNLANISVNELFTTLRRALSIFGRISTSILVQRVMILYSDVRMLRRSLNDTSTSLHKRLRQKQNLSAQLQRVLKTQNHHNAHVIVSCNIKMTNGCIQSNAEFQHQKCYEKLTKSKQ